MNKFCAGALIAIGAVAVTLFAVRISPLAQAQTPAGSAKAHATPILSGKLVGVEVWNRPPDKGSVLSINITQGRVEVYDQFILITSPEGQQALYPHGWYGNLRFRAE